MEDQREGLERAAKLVADGQVLLLFTGAGFSADSGLAVYDDVAKVKAYQERCLDYMDLCDPKLVHQEPPLFWGFWGQCFNDYRKTAPHEGYEILSRWVEKFHFRDSVIGQEIRSKLEKSSIKDAQSIDSIPAEPYEVTGHPGAFYIFTSNVDAHHYDWFRAQEIRECHGNVELYQCAFGRARCGPGIWRAPMDFHFSVDPQKMLALAGPSAKCEDDVDTEKDLMVMPCTVGAVRGLPRTTTLRYMPETQTPAHLVAKSFSGNHPKCARCGAAARPAVLMFGEWGDRDWLDSQQQSERWKNFMQALGEVVADSTGLKCVLLEIGAGGRVPTVRQTSEQILEVLLDGGANAKLIRINPCDFEADDSELENHVVGIQGPGLQVLKELDRIMETWI